MMFRRTRSERRLIVGLSHPAVAQTFSGEEVSALLKAGARPNTILPPDAWSFLMHASMWGNADAARVLLEAGADPNGNLVRAAVPLHLAAQNRHLDVIHLLIEYGADVNMQDRQGETAMFPALTTNETRRSSIPEALVRAGIDPDIRNKHGMTAFEAMRHWNSSLLEGRISDYQTQSEFIQERGLFLADVRRVEDLFRRP